MTNDEKIKELENQIKYLNENHDTYVTGILKKIQELKKPKYELYMPKPTDICYCPILMCGDKYSCFKDQEQCKYYGYQRQIFDALANFASHNDPTEKDRAWDEENLHWFILDVHSHPDYNRTSKNPTTIYFSTKELAEAALEMLKSEKLI